MGLFGFNKKEKPKKEVSKEEEFEIGSNGLIFNSKFQLLTKDKSYAKKVFDGYSEKIKNHRDIKNHPKYFMLKSKFEPPRKLKKDELKDLPPNSGKDVFISLLEFEVGVKIKTHVFDFCFEYMPFFIEVVEPMSINFSASELTSYVTNIQATLHKIDESLKDAILKNQNLTHSMIRLLRNNILQSLKEKNKNLSEVSKNVGVPEEQIKPFLDNMVKDNEVKLIKDKYTIKK